MIDLITEQAVVHSTPVLHMKNSKGLNKYWQGFVVTDGTEYYIKSHAWQETAGGGLSKVNEGVLNKVAGKNIGRANETTPKSQAVFEITSKMNKKRDEGYVEEGEVYVGYPLPMLAHKYAERSHNISYPCYVQPKLDGQRGVTDSKVFWTRKGKLFIPEVVEHLLFDTAGLTVDGEAILPRPFCFDDTEKAVKKFRSADKPEKGKECDEYFHTQMLEFHIFDVMIEDVPFNKRLEMICELQRTELPPQIKVVPTYYVESEEEALEKFQLFMEMGYEGIMFRNIDGLYKAGARSKDLQKLKEFQDDEFLVVDVIDGRGREEGAAIYVCVTDGGKQFTCRPYGTIEERRKIFAEKEQAVGRMLTVKYQNLTPDGIPRFLNGMGFKSDR